MSYSVVSRAVRLYKNNIALFKFKISNISKKTQGKEMSTNIETAKQFFEACETGKGWEGCNPFCHPDATFSSQTTVLAGISTLEAYCEWMKNLLIPIPDGHYELKFFGSDDDRNCIAAFAVFHGKSANPMFKLNKNQVESNTSC